MYLYAAPYFCIDYHPKLHTIQYEYQSQYYMLCTNSNKDIKYKDTET